MTKLCINNGKENYMKMINFVCLYTLITVDENTGKKTEQLEGETGE